MASGDIYPIIERNYALNEKIDSTPMVLVVRFKSDDGKPWPFDPGMFMMIFGVDKEGKRHIGRAFSIASDPSASEIEFFIVKEPRHPKVAPKPAAQAATATAAPANDPAPATATEPATAAPAQAAPSAQAAAEQQPYSHFVAANIGDQFVLKGPSGQFRFDPAKDSKVLFLAGGTGLAPFMSMLRHMKVTGSKPDVRLIYSIKYPNEEIMKDELEQLIRDIGAKMDITVTRPQPGDDWTGLTGHVTAEMIEKCSSDCVDRMCYICGPLPFVKAVKDALAAINVPPQRISADVWG